MPARDQGLILSVALRDPASEAAIRAIERAVASVPQQPAFPIDVTFPGESEPDLIDDWVSGNTRPFYSRG